jgi:flagellar motor switch protein FliG
MSLDTSKPLQVIDKGHPLSGIDKAAIILLSLPAEMVGKIFAQLDTAEIIELSSRMATLGIVRAQVVEDLYVEFVDSVGSAGSLIGTFEATERLLEKFFSKERVQDIMEEIRGPAGRNMWEKLGNVNEGVLANYLRNEYPQTAAVILSRIKSDHAARVFALLPKQLALDIMIRMLKMEVVQRDVLEDVEKTLKTEFMSNLAKSYQKDPYEHIAEVFNAFDRNTESEFMEALENVNKEAAEKIKSLMFTFDDLVRLDSTGIQTIIRAVDKTRLALALKGASEDIKNLFFRNMSERAAKLMKEDMVAMGMVRLRDVDEAQQEIITITKDLAAKGEIVLVQGAEDEQLIE